MRKIQKISVVSLAFLLAGCCEMGPDYKRPKLDMPSVTEDNLNTEKEINKFVTYKWWQLFQDPTLNKLEEKALENNADLKQAIANIEIARSEVDTAEANSLPAFGLNGAMTKTYASNQSPLMGAMKKIKQSQNNANANSDDIREVQRDWTAGLGLSYELDFFGKYRRGNEAARAQLLSTVAAKDWVLIGITSEVARAYFTLRALDAKLAIARRTLKSREESCAVYKTRFATGYCTELDYLRRQAEMASVKTTVLSLETAVARAETALSVLIGCSPKEIVERQTTRSGTLESLKIPSYVPKDLPSDLLTRRPDVLQVEGMLIAANAQIGAARAAYFPSLALTSNFGFESMSLKNLFRAGNESWTYQGNISLPIFSGGRIDAMNARAEANHKRMLAMYEKTVQTAFKETLDALVVNRKNREIVSSRTLQVNALKRSYYIAKKQKDSGLIGLLDLLDVERGLLAAEMDLVEALQNQLNAVVDLCKALGGGWKCES